MNNNLQYHCHHVRWMACDWVDIAMKELVFEICLEYNMILFICCQQAIKNNAGLRLWVLFFLVVCSFSLLFLDWYS